jgi:hypothetical protein
MEMKYGSLFRRAKNVDSAGCGKMRIPLDADLAASWVKTKVPVLLC